jgi:hypothetical protein
MPQAGRLHSLAKTICGSAPAGAAKEQSSHDHSEDRKRDGLWNCWLQREKRRHLSRFSQVIETVRGQSCGRNRLDADQPVALGLDGFNPSSLKALFVGRESGLRCPNCGGFPYCAIPAATPARACQEDAHASGEHFRPHLARS